MKKQLLTFAFIATFIKLLFTSQFASAQDSRIWSTYYGGKGDEINGMIVTDASGNVYMVGGNMGSHYGPTNINNGTLGPDTGLATPGAYQHANAGGWDVFLVKFDANGNRLWCTYYGGEDDELASGIAIDPVGNVYLAGYTFSTTGIASGGYQNTYGGILDAFLVKFDSSGNRVWGTYYGGTGTNNYENNISVATDAFGNVFLAGATRTADSIAYHGFDSTYYAAAFNNGFLVKFDANGNRLWATYYGGPKNASGGGLATDPAGNVFLAGVTQDTNGIAFGGFQNTLQDSITIGTPASVFLVKFDANGNRLWGTYYNGWDGEAWSNFAGIATDVSGNVYLTGFTADTSNVASGGFQNILGGEIDAFLVKFAANGNRLWATYYGGSLTDGGLSIATDAARNVWLAGSTTSANNIASGGFQDTYTGGGNNGTVPFLANFDSSGKRHCATYYGEMGAKNDRVGLALDKAGHVYLSATVDVTDTSMVGPGGFQPNEGGAHDVILAKFTTCTVPNDNLQSSDTSLCVNECINFTDHTSNATSWKWSFLGGTPSSSTDQNPQSICYYTTGNYDVKLITSNSYGGDTLSFSSFIKVFVAPITPTITHHNDTLFCSTDPSYTSYQWYDSTTLIPGATDTFLVVTHGGNYNVAVTNEFGCKISVGITIANNVGINEISINNFISLSPNPASDQLLIYTSSRITGKAIISIINVLGQEVLSLYSLSLGEGRGEAVNIKNIPSGMYFLQMKTENAIDIKRFVKE